MSIVQLIKIPTPQLSNLIKYLIDSLNVDFVLELWLSSLEHCNLSFMLLSWPYLWHHLEYVRFLKNYFSPQTIQIIPHNKQMSPIVLVA